MTQIQLSLFAASILGHFVGDYLFQNQWMATKKSNKGWAGHLACTVHVVLYTFAIALLTQKYNWLFLLIVAVPHWIIDRWSLATYWLRFKNGYWMKDTWQEAPLCAKPAPKELEQNVWKVAFAAPVYIFNDNSLHWLCFWFTIKWLF